MPAIAEKKSKADAKSRGLTPPEVRAGDMVWWYQNGLTNNTPLPAVVVVVGANGTLMLNVFTSGGVLPVQATRHKDDPGLNVKHTQRYGCWAERK